jgi:hypothetical protein
LAAVVSAGVHAVVIAALWSVRSAGAAQPFDTDPPHDVERRWNPVTADGEGGGARSRILEVLQSPDAVRVILTPVSAEQRGKGLAWWSPTRGIWMAVTGLAALPLGHAYHLWLVRQDGPPLHVGGIGVNEDGTGRLLALTRPDAGAIEGPVVIVVTEETGAPSPRLTAEWTLSGRTK